MQKPYIVGESAQAMAVNVKNLGFLWSEAINYTNYSLIIFELRWTRGWLVTNVYFQSKVHLLVYNCIPNEQWMKLNPKFIAYIMIGYFEESKAYWCYNLIMKKILSNDDVIFDEHWFWHPDTIVSRWSSVLFKVPLYGKDAI